LNYQYPPQNISILELAEKNYENRIEAFTNNAIDSAVASLTMLGYHCRSDCLLSQTYRIKVVNTE
jgi:hypothetical protein